MQFTQFTQFIQYKQLYKVPLQFILFIKPSEKSYKNV